jgi:hypothetical protein
MWAYDTGLPDVYGLPEKSGGSLPFHLCSLTCRFRVVPLG